MFLSTRLLTPDKKKRKQSTKPVISSTSRVHLDELCPSIYFNYEY